MRKRGSYRPRGREEEPYKVNRKIRAREVRVVGDNVKVDIYSIDEALKMAEEQNLILWRFHQRLIHLFVKLSIIRNLNTNKRRSKRKSKPSHRRLSLKKFALDPILTTMILISN